MLRRFVFWLDFSVNHKVLQRYLHIYSGWLCDLNDRWIIEPFLEPETDPQAGD